MANTEHHDKAILVAEDESIILAGVVIELESEGFQVIAVSDAQEALRELERHPEVTTLFTDINMPGPIDGLCLAHKVARIRPGVDVILTSGRDPPAGADLPKGARFLPKPYNYSRLTAMIGRAA